MEKDPAKKKMKIHHTVWSNGHVCNWSLVDVSELFYHNIYGDKIFAWFRLGKEPNKK